MENRAKAIVFGTFDGLHKGHVFFLKSAKKAVKMLIVIVARDKNVKRLKGKEPLKKEQERLKDVKELRIADLVELGDIDDFFKPLKKHRPDIIFLGYDQKSLGVENFARENGIKVARIAPYMPEKYKSSLINRQNNKRKAENKLQTALS